MQTLQVFTNLKTIKPGADNWLVVGARLRGMIVTGGVGLRLLSELFRKHMTALVVRGFYGHTVLVGLGARARAFATDILAGKHGAIVVFDPKITGSVADFCALNHIRALEGDGLVPETLGLANLRYAARAIVATGSDERNLGIAKAIRDLLAGFRRERPLALAVLIEDPVLAHLVAHDDRLRADFYAAGIEATIFNPARAAAIALLADAVVARGAYAAKQTRISLVMIGISDTAIEVLLQFLRTAPALQAFETRARAHRLAAARRERSRNLGNAVGLRARFWRVDRELDGWRWGPRDDRRRRHPDLVRYDDLPESTKDYDRAQIRFLAAIGLGG